MAILEDGAEGAQGTNQQGTAAGAQGAAAPPPAQGAQAQTRVMGTGGELSEEAVSARMARERRKFLRDEYGTDDEAKVEEIRKARQARDEAVKAKEEELARYKAAEDERKRASMSELEKVQADLAAARAECDRLKQQIARMDRDLLSERQENQLNAVAGRHNVEPRHVKLLKVELATHYRTLPKREQERFDEKQVDRFVRDWAKENPDYCKKAAPNGGQQAQQRQTVKKPLGTQAQQRATATTTSQQQNQRPVGSQQVPPDVDPATGKTTRPGQPNSMNKQELRAWAKKNGVSIGY